MREGVAELLLYGQIEAAAAAAEVEAEVEVVRIVVRISGLLRATLRPSKPLGDNNEDEENNLIEDAKHHRRLRNET